MGAESPVWRRARYQPSATLVDAGCRAGAVYAVQQRVAVQGPVSAAALAGCCIACVEFLVCCRPGLGCRIPAVWRGVASGLSLCWMPGAASPVPPACRQVGGLSTFFVVGLRF